MQTQHSAQGTQLPGAQQTQSHNHTKSRRLPYGYAVAGRMVWSWLGHWGMSGCFFDSSVREKPNMTRSRQGEHYMPRAYSRYWIKAFRGIGDVRCGVAPAVKRWLRLRWAGPDETEPCESEALTTAGDKQVEGSYFCLFCETGEF